MKILGLDTGTKTGWAILQIGGGFIVESGVQDFTKKRGESNGLMFLRFRVWLKDLIENCYPSLVAYEQAHFRGGAATEIGVGLQTRVQEICAERKIEAAPVHSGTLKKFTAGHGKASKATMMEIARDRLGREPIDDNESDAVAACFWAKAEFYGKAD